MRRIYQALGGFLVLLYGYGAFSGWDASFAPRRTRCSGARNAGGYRSYHFWSGGK